MPEWSVLKLFYFSSWAGIKLVQAFSYAIIGDVIAEEVSETRHTLNSIILFIYFFF